MTIQTKTANVQRGAVLHSLQAARGIAAVLVVLYHNSLAIFAQPKYWGLDPFHNLFAFGDSGVEFFFVLSGFIILYVHWADIGKPDRVFRYLKKRVLRIYPIYWVVLPAIIITYARFLPPSHDFTINLSSILSSALLIHFSSSGPILGVAWTLFHEVLFYAFFATLILNKRIGAVIVFLWLLASFFLISASEIDVLHEFTLSPLRFFFSPLHLLFAMGMASAWLVRHTKVAAPLAVAVFGFGLFSAVAMEKDYAEWLSWDGRAMLYGIASSCILAGTATMELRGKLKIAPLLELLGNASYSVYLVHLPLLSVMAKIFFVTGAKAIVPPLAAYILMAIAAVSAGVVMHLFVEKPMLKYLERYTAGAKR